MLRPPAAMNERIFEPLPCVTGPACSIAEVGSRRSSVAFMFSAEYARPPCECVAPFGRPVVPLV